MADTHPPKPTLRALLSLAWPVVISRSSQSVVGLGDALMVAALGERGLAATGAGAFNFFAFAILPMGTIFIVSSFSSQLFGKGDLAGARRYGLYGQFVSAITQIVALAAIPFIPMALGFLDYEPEVRASMDTYLRIRLLSAGAAIGVEAFSNYYGGLNNTRLPMIANLCAMVIDVFGNWLFITGNWGAPALGVAGAALTSTVSTWLAFIGLFIVFIRDGKKDQKKSGAAVWPRLRWKEFVRMLRFGLPSGFNWFFEFAAFLFFVNVVIVDLGTAQVAAFMAVMNVNSVAFMPAFGIASAGSILVGQAIGAGTKDDVPHVVRITVATAATWQGLVGLTYLVAPELLFSAFARGPGDTRMFLEVGARMLVLSSAWQLFDAAGMTLAEALRAAGDTAFPMWSRIALAWLVFAPGSYLTIEHLGWREKGAMLWLIAYLALLAALLYARFRSGAWRRFELTEPEIVAPA